MAQGVPAYDAQELLERVRTAARSTDLGAHREVFARTLPRVQGWMLMSGLVAAVLTVIAVALTSELLTRTDQTGGKLGNVIGLVVVVPLALVFGIGSVGSLGMGLFGPATSRAVRLDLYDRGLVFTDNGVAHAVRYDTTVIYQELVRHLLSGKTTHDYTLLDVDGKEIRLQDYSQGGLPNAARWGAVVQQCVTAAQLPIWTEKVNRGVTVAFGDLWLTQYEFGAGAKSVRWSQVRRLTVLSGDLRVHADGRVFALTNTPVRKIPNFYVFLAVAEWLIAGDLRPGGRRAAPPAPSSTTVVPDELHVLLTMVMGNKHTAERLIAYEAERLPGEDRAAWIAKAVERLRRDRERQG